MMRLARLAIVLALAAGCDWSLQRMNDTPRCEAGERTSFLPDRRCTQPTPDGTVAYRAAAVNVPRPAPTRALITRGADRFARFCAPCHGSLGDARSPVAADMMLRPPPSLHEPRILADTDVRIYEVIGTGYGLMPAYGAVLAPMDRWAVVHFVRVLQQSQRVALDQLPPARREEAMRWLP